VRRRRQSRHRRRGLGWRLLPAWSAGTQREEEPRVLLWSLEHAFQLELRLDDGTKQIFEGHVCGAYPGSDPLGFERWQIELPAAFPVSIADHQHAVTGDCMSQDRIERRLAERQIGRVRLHQFCGESSDPFACDAKLFRGDVDADDRPPELGHNGYERAAAATKIEEHSVAPPEQVAHHARFLRSERSSGAVDVVIVPLGNRVVGRSSFHREQTVATLPPAVPASPAPPYD
jgi:hypothetical protein